MAQGWRPSLPLMRVAQISGHLECLPCCQRFQLAAATSNPALTPPEPFDIMSQWQLNRAQVSMMSHSCSGVVIQDRDTAVAVRAYFGLDLEL